MSEISKYPLYWPEGVARTQPERRSRPQFTEKTIDFARRSVFAEIDRLNCSPGYTIRRSVIISSNLRLRRDGEIDGSQGEPKDPGIAVYFPLIIRRSGQRIERPIVLTCDKWTKCAWNLYAIAKDIEAQRGRIRWGCTNFEQSFQGYLALPQRASGKPWWEVLGLPHTITQQGDVRSAFRRLTLTKHPDKGGSREEWDEIQEAYDQGLAATT